MMVDALPSPIIPFEGWRPDRAALGNPGSTEALNVIPSADGFRPLKTLTAVSDALTARCRGAFAATGSSGTAHIYAGDETNLYELIGATFSDISGATYTTAADGNWEFALYGQRVLATNYDDAVQGITIGGAAFANQITSTLTPKARHIAVVRDFTVLGNTNDGTDGQKQNRVWWSGINDPTDFDPNATTQCDFQDVPEGGWVQKIVGGADYGLVFMERQIQRMTYVGSPLIWRFDAIDRERGTPIPKSVVGLGRMVFFISEEGFFMTDGLRSVPIGHEEVDRKFWDNFDSLYASRVSSIIDPLSKTVMWAWPDTSATNGEANNIYIYNWVSKKWSHASVNTQHLFLARGLGYTLDSLDTVGTDIDNATTFPFSFDSRAWTGGEFKLAAFDTDNKYATFTGSNMAATLETTETQPHSNGRSRVTRVRPLVEGSGTITTAIAPRDALTETATFGSAASLNTDGSASVDSEGRYHRVRVSVAAGGTWTHAQGVGLDTVIAVGVQ